MNDSIRTLSAIDSLPTWLGRSLWLFVQIVFCSSLLVDRVEAQYARGAIAVEFSDPLKKVGGMGTRSIDVTISMANPGAVATRDEFFYVVFCDNARARPRKLTAVARVLLPKGAATVSTELIAPRSLSNYYDFETIFVETDGDLTWRGGRSDLAAMRTGQTYRNYSQDDDRIEFLFITDSPKIKNGSEKWIVDRTQNIGSPLFRYVDSNQTIAPAVTGVTTPPTTPNANVGGSGTAAKTLPAVVMLQELISQANYVDARYTGGTATGDPSSSVADLANPTEIDNQNYFLGYEFFVAIPKEQIPARWQGLMQVDFMFISLSDLNSLAGKAETEQIRAVQSWVAAGGRLVVTDCGSQFEHVRQIPTALFQHGLNEDESLANHEWKSVHVDRLDDALKAHGSNADQDSQGASRSRIGMYGTPMSTQSAIARTMSNPKSLSSVHAKEDDFKVGESPPDKLSAVFFNHLQGRVIALPGDCVNYTKTDWERLLGVAFMNGQEATVSSTIGEGHLQMNWMGNFVVPGVGEPPRILFLFLIVGFAILVGPVGYTILYRKQRLNFLLAFVPLVSMVATLGLLLFAVLSDGFIFRSQRISVTRIDQRTGTAVTQTEQAIFSGSNPLSYQANSNQAMFVAKRYQGGQSKFLQVGDETSISGPEIRSRVPHQVTTFDVGQTDSRFRIIRQSSEEAGEQLAVTNQFGGNAKFVIVKTDKGIYVAKDLPHEASQTMVELGESELVLEIDLAMSVTKPFRETLVRVNNWSPQYYDPSNRTTSNWGLAENKTRNGRSLVENLRPGEYLAILDDSPIAHQLHPNPVYYAQLHVVLGQW